METVLHTLIRPFHWAVAAGVGLAVAVLLLRLHRERVEPGPLGGHALAARRARAPLHFAFWTALIARLWLVPGRDTTCQELTYLWSGDQDVPLRQALYNVFTLQLGRMPLQGVVLEAGGWGIESRDAVRVFSALAGAAAVALGADAARLWSGSAAAWCVGVLLALNPLQVFYGASAEPYAPFYLVAALLLDTWLRIVLNGSRRAAWVHGAALVVGFYLQLMTVAWEAALVAAFLACRPWRDPETRGRLVLLLRSVAWGALACVPWVPALWIFFDGELYLGDPTHRSIGYPQWHVATWFAEWGRVLLGYPPTLRFAVPAGLALAAYGLGRSRALDAEGGSPDRLALLRWLVALGIAETAAYVALQSRAGTGVQFLFRHSLYFGVCVALASSRGALRLAKEVGRRAGLAAAAAAVAASLLGTAGLVSGPDRPALAWAAGETRVRVQDGDAVWFPIHFYRHAFAPLLTGRATDSRAEPGWVRVEGKDVYMAVDDRYKDLTASLDEIGARRVWVVEVREELSGLPLFDLRDGELRRVRLEATATRVERLELPQVTVHLLQRP